MSEIYNFSAGPAILPKEVLQKAQAELLSIGGTGMSVMEISHRSKYFEPILEKAEKGIRSLLDIPANYRVLFLQGGASLQFSMVPLNFLKTAADYVVTGAWGEKAVSEARKNGAVNVVFSSRETGYKSIPEPGEIRFSPAADYIHYCSNETIDGVEFTYDLDGGQTPIVCDASSNILSKPIDISRYALIYAGAQKNIGPSGVTVVIIRDDLLERVPAKLPAMLDYRNFAANSSMPNTPNTWGIYLVSLVCDWLTERGGVSAIAGVNQQKAQNIYEAIDRSEGFYTGHAEKAARSLMNITFRLESEKLEERFITEAAAAGFDGLKGHRSVGGVRASIYNAFPLEGTVELAEFMKDFSLRNG